MDGNFSYVNVSIQQASISVLKKPSGISSLDEKRSDVCTLIPWRAGRCLAWERYVHITSKEIGLAATRALDKKIKKYDGALPPQWIFYLFASRFLARWTTTLPNFLKIFAKSCVKSDDSRELFFAMNHISCLLQKFLRVCVTENVQLNADVSE
ncbi:hypothetical protein HELRODRAFT_174208 [Helobdella robusta]|uniref:Uncharacterized protein n=1 Tax=Helobdella robusta TaxID=6412 RepID=T1F7S7_HELRO|nr:hypothetical protein HELRODRAFT_174208 [Helobdella robusta]ESO02790.1 hypothetical protein HELRODRAFT_174208 [Helobdella robusta]